MMNNQNMKETARVGLRLWSTGDLPLLERLLGDPRMTEYLGGPEDPETMRKRHENFCRLPTTDTGLMYVITVGPEELPAGSIGYWQKEWNDQTVWETGWSVLPEFQGRGIATKATLLIIEQARAARKHRYLHAFPSVDNHPSNAICRKTGFEFQGEYEFEYPPGNPVQCNDWRFDLFFEEIDPDGGVK
jgi:RimJ/RimL family protein N-acetyltransferase